jgi:hypothetical protein
MGIALNLSLGLTHTWHFSLFSSLFNRLRHSHRRTLDPSLASLFIIPYDFAMDGNFRKDCTRVHRCSPGYAAEIWHEMISQPYFQRWNGSDHVLLWSLGQYHPWPRNDCNLLMSVWCKRCVVTCYWMDPTLVDNHFVSIPFPSSYHWHEKAAAVRGGDEGGGELPWMRTGEDGPPSVGVRSVVGDTPRLGVFNIENSSSSSPQQQQRHTPPTVLESVAHWGRRKHLISYLGGTQTLNPEHTKIRREMTERCLQQSNQTLCNWIQLAHTSTDETIISSLAIYRTSIFCLCPPGDDPARKALFDILLSGCIPILFHPSTLYNQYPLHFPKNIPQEISVYVPGKFLKLKKIPFIEMVSAMSWQSVRRKQLWIEKIATRIQYSLLPLDMLRDHTDERVWDPPMLDAVDVLLNGFMTRAQRMERNESTQLPPIVMTSGEWFQKYNSVRGTT